MQIQEIILCMAVPLLSSVSQLFLKSASGKPSLFQFLPHFFVACCFMLSSILLCIWVLQYVSLQLVVMFGSSVYIFVPVGAAVFFKEQLGKSFYFGISLILTGILVSIL